MIVARPAMPADRALSENAGYARPWVVSPGQTVDLHASLATDSLIDVVRIECANAERTPDGETIGPAPRLIPVPQAPARRCAAHPQPLDPGTRIDVRLVRPCPAADTTLLIGLQWLARGMGGHVVSLLGDDGAGWRIDLHRGTDRSAQVSVRTDAGLPAQDDAQSGVLTDLAVPVGAWLILALRPSVENGGCLQVRSAIGNASLPDPGPRDWVVHPPIGIKAAGGGPPPTFSRLRIGTGEDRAPCADVRIDLLSLVPCALADRLCPDDLFAPDPAPGPLAGWERELVGSELPTCLVRGRCSADSALFDPCGNAVFQETQRPYTAVRGARWDGRHQSPAQAPAQYTACHLHSDAMLDAGWDAELSWQVPADLPSGCYAFRMASQREGPEAVRYASFFVSGAQRPRHRLAVLMPTFTYLAYANAPEDMRGPPMAGGVRASESLLERCHPAFGRSLYERHVDGYGVLFSSSRRPLLSVTPEHRPWGLVADTLLLDWLRRIGQPFDVITDHDLHRLGRAALDPFSVVLTGHHPEYWSTPMWDGLWRYLDSGGRLMYLGGNGLYWKTAYNEAADMIEVRRAEDGTRASIAPPGEYHGALDGAFGGLWRRNGRAPQQIVGVGMAAQGFERAAHYQKCDDAQAPEVAFVFEGVPAGTFGHHGLLGGGASGWEIDRIDEDLGTPAGTWWLARSRGHAPSMLRTKEELLSYIAPFDDAKARSDVALVPAGKGDVFAVGSMTWVGSLHPAGEGARSDADAPTDVARITANVIRRFLDPRPVPRKTVRPHG